MLQDFKTEIKTLLIVAFIAVVISVAGILLLRNDVRNQVSPTPSPVPNDQSVLDTSNWQTYRNDKFEFEFRYPHDWVGPFIEGPGSSVVSSSEEPRVTVQIVTESGNLGLFETLENAEVGEVVEANLIFYSKIANDSIGGYPAVRYTADYRNVPAQRLPTGEEVLIKKDNQIFELRMWGSSFEAVRNNKNTFHQILSTFRFVEVETNLKPAEAQTPAAGACAGPDLSDLAEIVLVRTPDNVPVPRCLLVSGDQRLQIKNATDEAITVTLGRIQMTIEPGKTQADSHTFDSYLASGVHSISSSPAVLAPEIWLQ